MRTQAERRTILEEAQEKMKSIRLGKHSILDLPTDIETIAAAVYNISVMIEELIDD